MGNGAGYQGINTLKHVIFLLGISFIIILNGCGNINSSKDSEQVTAIVEEKVATAEDPTTFSENVQNSLLSCGNNYRISKVFDKMAKGEEVKIAYLGGSITEGYLVSGSQNYASQTTKHLRSIFNNDNIKTVNAGLSGTSSTIGLLRVNTDVLAEAPDVIVIEFAVNDGQDIVSQNAFDSLIKQCLGAENHPAVILLFTVLENGFTCEKDMMAIGEKYSLPMVSINSLLEPQLKDGTLKWSDYAQDEAHPNYQGHKMIAECLEYYFLYAKSSIDTGNLDSEIDYTDISALGANYSGMVLYNSLSFTPEALGGFEAGSSNIEHFPNGWIWGKGQNGVDSMKFNINGKNLFILYKEDSNDKLGNMEVYVDGEYKQTICGNSDEGWNNPQVALLLNLNEAGTHEIEIKPEAGSEEKIFNILGFGTTGELEGSFIPEAEVDPASIPYQERAIVNVGNTYQLQELFKRARNGEKLTIGFIGGSITQGTGASGSKKAYAQLVYNWFCNTFPEAEFEMVNAGIGATTSQFACARVDEDLLSYKPDFVVVEFSVNDESNNLYRETYESIIRKILMDDSSPAVLTLNMVQYDTGNNAQSIHSEVSKYYNLPEISMKDSIYKEIQLGRLSADQVSSDMLHPNDLGHQYTSEIVTYYLDKVLNGSYGDMEKEALPEASMDLYSINSVRYNNRNTDAKMSGFEKDTAKQNEITDIFRNGWSAAKEGATISFEVKGSYISLQYKKTNLLNAPTAVAIIDGDEDNPIELDGNYPDGWGDWLYLQDIYTGTAGTHTVEVRLTSRGTNAFYLVSAITR